jgi:hypothetical protein
MIKDIIVNLERNEYRDCVRDYAITVARTFDAHLAGVAFADGASISLGAFAGGANIPVFIVSGQLSLGLPPTLLRTSWPKMKRLHAAQSSVSRRWSRAAFFRSSTD